MTTNEVAEKYGLTRVTIIKWCQKNKLKRKLGRNGIMEYVLTEKDIKKFETRKGKGRGRKKAKPE
jgi:predicted site-specific integrase-resolvase